MAAAKTDAEKTAATRQPSAWERELALAEEDAIKSGSNKDALERARRSSEMLVLRFGFAGAEDVRRVARNNSGWRRA